MTIKTNSIIAYYYRWMFNGNLANDFCTLFWNTVASVLLLPLTIPAYIASLIVGKEAWSYRNLLGKAFRGIITYFLSFLGLCVGLMGFEKVFGNAWRTWDFWPVVGAGVLGFIGIALCFIVVVFGLCGSVMGIMWIGLRIKRLFQKKVVNTRKLNGRIYEEYFYTPREFKLIAMWNAIRNKYCTKIEWK